MSVEVEEAKGFTSMGFKGIEGVIEEAEVASVVDNIGWRVGLLSSSFASASTVLDKMVGDSGGSMFWKREGRERSFIGL